MVGVGGDGSFSLIVVLYSIYYDVAMLVYLIGLSSRALVFSFYCCVDVILVFFIVVRRLVNFVVAASSGGWGRWVALLFFLSGRRLSIFFVV